MLDRNGNYGEGRLPALAPLANPYVPFQEDNPPKYEAQRGLVRGTLFPGLDLPFLGKENKELKPATPLNELQAMGFALQELALYLDTHQNDKEALELYRTFQKMYREGKQKYEKLCGPLTHMSYEEGAYRWLESPWPWEYNANQEG